MHRCSHAGFAAFHGPRVVYLDTRSDRYGLLSGDLSVRLLGCREARDTMRGLEPLHDLGLLSSGPGDPIWPEMPRPRRSAVDEGVRSQRPALMPVLASLATTIVRLRLSGLHVTLARLRRLRAKAELRHAPEDAAALAVGFRATRRLLPFRNICLEDSLMLSERLIRHGVASDMVFGVRLDPFSAHCWVQTGDLLLSDPIANVTEFTPVYVV